MSPLGEHQLRRVVELACRAPSVLNTQPWRWRVVRASRLELQADRSRQLPVADPDGRLLVLSCGAALQHAAEAARSLGAGVRIARCPVPDSPDLLARLWMMPGRPPSDGASRLLALEQRCTDRRRFTAWPVPEARLRELAAVAPARGVSVVPVTDPTTRFRIELLLERALTMEAADCRYAEERVAWLGRHCGAAAQPTSTRVLAGFDGLMAICTVRDDQQSWLRAGEALGALWLSATRTGLSIVPLSQPIEVEETRLSLRHLVVTGTGCPQLLLRVGWQEISRATLPRTPRRPVSEVLVG